MLPESTPGTCQSQLPTSKTGFRLHSGCRHITCLPCARAEANLPLTCLVSGAHFGSGTVALRACARTDEM
eukprot:6085601-Prymnesium_polylepis.1